MLVKAMIFALEYKYPILSQVEKGASDTSFMKAIHRLTEFLLDYFKDCFTKDEISKDLPLDWEQIINKLREAEIFLSRGETVALISKKIGVSAHTYYRWRKEYGGMRVDQARRLKELEQENSRLKKLVADLSLDNAILKEASRGNF